jgi:hypothetical protein
MVFIGLTANNVFAQSNTNPITSITREFYCYETDALIRSLLNSYKETPLVIGKNNDQSSSNMSLWVNPSTRTWTLVATKDDISCVIGSGSDIKLNPMSKGQPV